MITKLKVNFSKNNNKKKSCGSELHVRKDVGIKNWSIVPLVLGQNNVLLLFYI